MNRQLVTYTSNATHITSNQATQCMAVDHDTNVSCSVSCSLRCRAEPQWNTVARSDSDQHFPLLRPETTSYHTRLIDFLSFHNTVIYTCFGRASILAHTVRRNQDKQSKKVSYMINAIATASCVLCLGKLKKYDAPAAHSLESLSSWVVVVAFQSEAFR